MNPIQILLCLFGGILIVDGIGSIIKYWPQHWYEHAVRVVRTIIGAGLIVIAIYAWRIICLLVIR